MLLVARLGIDTDYTVTLCVEPGSIALGKKYAFSWYLSSAAKQAVYLCTVIWFVQIVVACSTTKWHSKPLVFAHICHVKCTAERAQSSLPLLTFV